MGDLFDFLGSVVNQAGNIFAGQTRAAADVAYAQAQGQQAALLAQQQQQAANNAATARQDNNRMLMFGMIGLAVLALFLRQTRAAS